MKKKLFALALTAVLVIGCLTACGQKAEGVSGKVATDGSTSMEKVIGSLGEAFTAENEDVDFTYNPTGSGSGISSAANGTCDIGLSSRYLKDEEKEQGLEETVLAYDGIAVIVSTANGVNDLSLAHIGAVLLLQCRYFIPVEPILSARGIVEQSEDVEQR